MKITLVGYMGAGKTSLGKNLALELGLDFYDLDIEIEKRSGFRLGAKDVFLNITGGISVDDPAIDLAVIAAILSSNEDIPIEKGVCFAAEVGLAGEIRPVQRIDQRILEAEKLGFKTIYVSKNNKIGLKNSKINIELASRIEDVVSGLFG